MPRRDKGRLAEFRVERESEKWLEYEDDGVCATEEVRYEVVE
jgi:hypothetical protein